jgi:hypothetical protein
MSSRIAGGVFQLGLGGKAGANVGGDLAGVDPNNLVHAKERPKVRRAVAIKPCFPA